MNKRNLLIIAAWVLCLGTVWAVFQQRTRLTRLQSEPQDSTEQPAVAASTTAPDAHGEPPSSSLSPMSDDTSRELLRLRAEVTRLTARKRELAGVAETSEGLHAQLASGSTNSGGIPLPPGYVRRADAQLLGYSTPENTVQSWLWALQHHDATNYLRALPPMQAERIRAAQEISSGELFKGMDAIPGLAIQNHRDLPDGSVELEVYVVPGMPPQTIHLQAIAGEWRITGW